MRHVYVKWYPIENRDDLFVMMQLFGLRLYAN